MARRPPLRLRDVRRLAAQHVDVGRWSISIGRPSASRAFSRGVLEEVLGATDTAAAVLAALDRAITRYGPDADFGELLQGQRPRQQGEARPKDTAEVAEASAQDDGDLHGGDGASGEVEDSTPTGGPVGGGGTDGDSTSSGAGAPRHEASAAPADDEPATTADAGAPGAEAGTGERSPGAGRRAGADSTEPHVGEAEDGAPATPSPESTSTADTPPRDAAEGAQQAHSAGLEGTEDSGTSGADEEAGGRPLTPADAEPSDAPRRGRGSSRGPRAIWGGDHVEREALRVIRTASRREAREVRRALDRLLARLSVGLGSEPSPRLHARRLVSELAARRARLSRARREELERPLTIVAADVSGSCSAVATETLAAALACAEADPTVLVIEHSNGYVHALYGERARELGALAEGLAAGQQNLLDGIGLASDREALLGRPRESWWRALLQRYRVAGVVAFGDADAGDIYHELDRAGVPVYWLDSHCCAALGYRPRPSSGQRLRHGAYWIGVSSAQGAAYALREMARRGRQ